jgi:hypothetical protein
VSLSLWHRIGPSTVLPSSELAAILAAASDATLPKPVQVQSDCLGRKITLISAVDWSPSTAPQLDRIRGLHDAAQQCTDTRRLCPVRELCCPHDVGILLHDFGRDPFCTEIHVEALGVDHKRQHGCQFASVAPGMPALQIIGDHAIQDLPSLADLVEQLLFHMWRRDQYECKPTNNQLVQQRCGADGNLA